MHVTIRLEGDADVRRALAAIGRQAPFAASLALNQTANAAQQAIRDQLPGAFMLRRRSFVERTIKRERGEDFATKRNLVAAVRIDATRDVLAKFVEGGEKRARGGGSVAVPVGVPRTGAGGVITKRWRPGALRNDPKVARLPGAFGKDLLVRFVGRGRGSRVQVLYRLQPSVRIRPLLPFHAIAERAVDAAWPVAVASAIERALATAR